MRPEPFVSRIHADALMFQVVQSNPGQRNALLELTMNIIPTAEYMAQHCESPV